jgi:RNA-directed DNA polymerase
MEAALGITYSSSGRTLGPRALVRYADDFVVFCQSQEDAHKAKTTLETWLKERGLAFSEEKTRIVDLAEGFDFLSFNIRRYKVTRSKTGWKLLIKPSRKAVQAIRDKLKAEWLSCKGNSVSQVLRRLNPIIRGWAHYFRKAVASQTFRKLNSWMFHRAVRYTRWTHPKKSAAWLRSRYWGRLHPTRKDKWVFGNVKTGAYLLKFPWFPIQRHVLVKGRASPDDPDLREYWQRREQQKASDLPPSRQKLARAQQGRCPLCGESLFNKEELQTDHIELRSRGGKDAYSNLRLVHLLCHQQRHARAAPKST